MNLTQDQIEKIEYLRSTTITGELSKNPKTTEEMIYQIIERGIASVEQTRKQYTRQKEAMQLFRAAQKSGRVSADGTKSESVR